MTSVTTAVNARVNQLIRQFLADGQQLGLQVCAYHDGEMVVDAWAGRMGPDDFRPVAADTLFLSFSTTKGVAATLVHMLADRGLLDYEAPVAQYWPAFGAHGKEYVTVAQALSHQAGLHRMPEPFSIEHLTGWEDGIARMESGVPTYPPGTETGYHAITFAWIVGGIVQGATGEHIKDLIEHEIAEPLGVAGEMYVGIPEGVEERLATIDLITPGEGLPIADDAEMFKAMPKTMWQHFNEDAVRRACLPSVNGHFTARALAKMYAALAGDGSIAGSRLVSEERLPAMRELMTDRKDLVIGTPGRKGIGFFLGGEIDGTHGPLGPRESAFGHPGAGGSVAFADPETRLAVAVTLNKMSAPKPGEGATLEICDAIRDELGVS